VIVCEKLTVFSDLGRIDDAGADAEGAWLLRMLLLISDDDADCVEVVVEEIGEEGGDLILRRTRWTAATKGRGPAFFLVL